MSILLTNPSTTRSVDSHRLNMFREILKYCRRFYCRKTKHFWCCTILLSEKILLSQTSDFCCYHIARQKSLVYGRLNSRQARSLCRFAHTSKRGKRVSDRHTAKNLENCLNSCKNRPLCWDGTGENTVQIQEYNFTI